MGIFTIKLISITIIVLSYIKCSVRNYFTIHYKIVLYSIKYYVLYEIIKTTYMYIIILKFIMYYYNC